MMIYLVSIPTNRDGSRYRHGRIKLSYHLSIEDTAKKRADLQARQAGTGVLLSSLPGGKDNSHHLR